MENYYFLLFSVYKASSLNKREQVSMYVYKR